MEKVDQAVKLAMEQFRKEFGEEAKLEDGDRFGTVFNDGILIIGLEDKKLSFDILAGEPYRVDFNLDLVEKED